MYIELSFWAYHKFSPQSSHHAFTPLFHTIKVHISMVCGIGSMNIYFSILKLKKKKQLFQLNWIFLHCFNQSLFTFSLYENQKIRSRPTKPCLWLGVLRITRFKL